MARGSRGDSNHADREFTLADLVLSALAARKSRKGKWLARIPASQLRKSAIESSSGHTEGLSRSRCYFCIRLAKRPGLFGKRIHLRLHELSLNRKTS